MSDEAKKSDTNDLAAELEAHLGRLPLFVDVAPVALKKMVSESTSVVFGQGAPVIEEGEFTGDFYIIISGIVGLYSGTPTGGYEYVMSLGADTWFGEMGALSNSARSVTVVAEAETVLYRVPRHAFRILYESKKAAAFRERIDETYKDRVTYMLLRSLTLFRGADEELLHEMTAGAVTEILDAGARIIEEGESSRDLWIVRTGDLKVTRMGQDGREELIAYMSDNSYFGEIALVQDVPRTSSVTTLTHCDLVRIPAQVILTAMERVPPMRDRVLDRVREIHERETGEDTGAMRAFGLEILVDQEVSKGGEALVIDMSKCTHCNMCIVGCIEAHEDRIPRIGKRGIDYGDLLLTSSCYNCKVPDCMLSCKFGAILRGRDGQVHIDNYACTGCTLCEKACPYGTIHMQSLASDKVPRKKESFSIFDLLTGWLPKKETPSEPPKEPEPLLQAKEGAKALAVKCDLCGARGDMACIYNCPCGAIMRIDPRVLLS